MDEEEGGIAHTGTVGLCYKYRQGKPLVYTKDNLA